MLFAHGKYTTSINQQPAMFLAVSFGIILVLCGLLR